MGDVLTEIPPPSRFFQEDLSNFTPPPPPIPSPFLAFSNPKPEGPLRPSLLVIALSRPSLYLFHHVTAKTLVGSLVLPEITFSGNSLEPSLGDKSCNIYAINDTSSSVLLVSVQCSISTERSHMVAKLLIGEKIIPESVLILNSFKIQSFRGRLSPDETYAYKLETSRQRKASADGCRDPMLLKDLNYFPSGSVVDGLPAALLARCEIKKIRGTLVVSWPEHGPSVVAMVKSLLPMKLFPGLDISQYGDVEDKIQHYLYT